MDSGRQAHVDELNQGCPQAWLDGVQRVPSPQQALKRFCPGASPGVPSPAAAESSSNGLSKRASKKLAKKQRKKAYKQTDEGAVDKARRTEGFSGEAAGKAGRARAARMGIAIESTRAAHRPRGGAPVTVLPEHLPVVEVLEAIESSARLVHHPQLIERAEVPMDCHGSMEVPECDQTAEPAAGSASLRNQRLRQFDLQLLPAPLLPDVSKLTALDVSRCTQASLMANVRVTAVSATGTSCGRLPGWRHCKASFNSTSAAIGSGAQHHSC